MCSSCLPATLHRPITTNWGSTVVSTAPSTTHQVVCNLHPDHVPAMAAEPPMLQLHWWTGDAFVSHTTVFEPSADRIEIATLVADWEATKTRHETGPAVRQGRAVRLSADDWHDHPEHATLRAMTEPIYDVRSFWELLEKRAAATPDRPMLIDATDRRVTFSEFKAWAERAAAGFQAMGIGENSVVTWQLPTRIETLVASFALSRLGAIQNPIIQIYRDREVGFALAQMRSEFVLVPGVWRNFDYVAMVERLSADLPAPPKIIVAYDSLPEGDPSTLPPPPAVPAARCGPTLPIKWVYYTSGTTSDPKGAQHTDGTLLAGGIGLALKLDMQPSDVGSIAFPYSHIGGPNYVVMMLTHGMPAVLLEAFVPAEAVEIYKRHDVTMAGGSTAFYISFINEQRKQPGEKIIPTLRILSGGGAPKPPELFLEVGSEIGARLCHGYGMTECPMISQGGPRDSDDQLMYSEGGPVEGCVITIVREDGSSAEPERGG